jgi:octaprenyl-diphosphate synthase
VGRATNRVCEGELRQKGSQGDYRLSEAEYLDIIAAKTAELCAASCGVGAYYAGASPAWIERFSNYGRHVGVAFQIVDDVLDLAGDEHTVGKSLGTDLDQQKLTLPLIRVLQQADAAERRQVLAILQSENNHRQAGLAPFFQRYEAFAYSYEVARRYTDSAAKELSGLEPSPALHSLHALTEFVVTRSR